MPRSISGPTGFLFFPAAFAIANASVLVTVKTLRLISLKAEARRSASDEPRITVDSNIDFELCVLYGGKEKKINVTSGKHTY